MTLTGSPSKCVECIVHHFEQFEANHHLKPHVKRLRLLSGKGGLFDKKVLEEKDGKEKCKVKVQCEGVKKVDADKEVERQIKTSKKGTFKKMKDATHEIRNQAVSMITGAVKEVEKPIQGTPLTEEEMDELIILIMANESKKHKKVEHIFNNGDSDSH